MVIWKSKGCESTVGDSWIWLSGLLRQIRRPEGGNRPIFRAFCNMKLPNFYKPNDHFFRKKRQNCPSPLCGKFRKVGTDKFVTFSKKVVVWSEKLGLLCVAADTKSWSLASHNAAIPSSPASCCSRFAALRQHKGAPILQTKQPLFWKKRQICASLGE